MIKIIFLTVVSLKKDLEYKPPPIYMALNIPSVVIPARYNLPPLIYIALQYLFLKGDYLKISLKILAANLKQCPRQKISFRYNQHSRQFHVPHQETGFCCFERRQVATCIENKQPRF